MPTESTPTPSLSWLARIRSIARGLGPAGPWFVVAAGGPVVGLLVLTATSTTWLPWFGEGLDSVLVFWGLGAVMAGLCLVPTQVASLVAGYLFGAWLGTVLGLLVVLLDAIGNQPKAARVHRALLGRSTGRTIWLIALLRLSPVLPFAATNLLMAAFGVRGSVFLVATAIGAGPRLIAVSLVGAELSELDWQAAGSWWATMVAIVATLLFLVVTSRIARNALRRETAEFERGNA